MLLNYGVGEDSWESLDCKEIKPVNPMGNQPWIFIGRTEAEAETQILWPPEEKNDSVEKTLMLRKTEGGRRRGRQRMRWPDTTERLNWVELKCMAVSLCCPLETSTALLINYSPTQNKKVKNKKEKSADPFSKWNCKITPNIFSFINLIERIKMNTQWNHKRRVKV